MDEKQWRTLLSGFSFGQLARAASTQMSAREVLFRMAHDARQGDPDALTAMVCLAREMGLPTDLEAVGELADILVTELGNPAAREGELLPSLFEVLPKQMAQRLREKLDEPADRALSPKGPVGMHGGTLDRVREAHELIMGGTPKTEACKRVHIDTRTYNEYVAGLVDWEADDD